jgi:arylsulfatase
VPAGKVENGIVSGLDWFPTFVAAAGNPGIADELKKGKQLGDAPTRPISTATTRWT